MKAWSEMTAAEMIADVREELLREQEMQDAAWDAGMTPAQRETAIAEEIRSTETRESAGSLSDSWSDPRTANLLGNYVTR